MFNKFKNNSSASLPALISPNTHVTGQIDCDGELQVDGKVTGDLKVSTLIVGQNGEVKGNIIAEKVQVKGTINGNIDAQSVHLEVTAKVHGDVAHDTLTIDAGAHLEGKLTHKQAPDNITPIKEQANAQ
ncbi:polymer-forming cytoskeletal protein [Pseudoalteromonas phenolica]|uniref:bactofilin family protein n=1 Tax=Pseudoalteromonas phenolica TaxID=161398 RepID=UPI00385005E1